MPNHTDRIESVLAALSAGPRNLRAYLEQPGPDFEKVASREVDAMIDLLLSRDPNAPERLRFSNLLRGWDNAKSAKWASDTARNTPERRQLIHVLLNSGAEISRRIDTEIPFFQLDEPLIIAEQHEDWYRPESGARDYYWRTYIKYLRERRDWRDESILNMENSTRAIVECLANPEKQAAYSSRGLVVGYVQSGKTANFTGVVAKAADAGYRLIIVLAGTWNILRNQTQRRFDKELLGKELLMSDAGYSEHPPADWAEFLEHGTDPVTLGHYTWQRLTSPEADFRRLKAAIDNLEFEKVHKDVPLYDPRNLHALPVKLLVIKKHSGVLGSLVKDLKLVRTKLVELPTLIIDDESDQAGLNTRDPAKLAANGLKDRTPTNARLVELLKLFPRGQYVGYTATPYANAFVDPDDEADLFPKDFLVPLERPIGYMGVADFFDPEVAFDDLDKGDFSLPEIAYIRRVESPQGQDDKDLKNALRSYLLAGGVKLFRQDTAPSRYKPEQFKHHTMLLHTSSRTGEQGSLAERLKSLWSECAFNSPKGLKELEKIWDDDHAKVCKANASEICPDAFDDLIPFLSEAIKRIESGPEVFLLVNSDRKDAPDFSASPVWKIVIGGNKLSRGCGIL